MAPLVDDAAYGDLTDYVGVPPGAYTLNVTPGDDNSTVVASFAADLSGLAGGAAVVLASGLAQMMPAGTSQRIQIDGTNLASGMYLYRLTARMDTDVQIQTGRMTLLK